MTAARRVTEAEVEREVLLELGRGPDLLVLKNEVGVGFTGNARYALEKALAPFGRLAVQAALAVLSRHHITWGLGVGSPDLVGAVDGRAVGLELKAPGGVLSDVQQRWHAAARQRGVFVATVRSPDEAVAAVQRAREGAVE
jgi:hypothetical protein